MLKCYTVGTSRFPGAEHERAEGDVTNDEQQTDPGRHVNSVGVPEGDVGSTAQPDNPAWRRRTAGCPVTRSGTGSFVVVNVDHVITLIMLLMLMMMMDDDVVDDILLRDRYLCSFLRRHLST